MCGGLYFSIFYAVTLLELRPCLLQRRLFNLFLSLLELNLCIPCNSSLYLGYMYICDKDGFIFFPCLVVGSRNLIFMNCLHYKCVCDSLCYVNSTTLLQNHNVLAKAVKLLFFFNCSFPFLKYCYLRIHFTTTQITSFHQTMYN